MRFLYNFSMVMLHLINLFQVIAMISIHVYTVYLFYVHWGVIAGTMSIFFPFISQFVLAIDIIMAIGWNNLYIAILGYFLSTFVLAFIFLIIRGIALYLIDKKEGFNNRFEF